MLRIRQAGSFSGCIIKLPGKQPQSPDIDFLLRHTYIKFSCGWTLSHQYVKRRRSILLMDVKMTEASSLIAAMKPYFQHYGYWAIVIAVLPAGFGIPTPGETTFIAAMLLASGGEMSPVYVLGVAFLSTLIGNTLGYWLGYYGGRPFVIKYGQYAFVTEERLGRVETFFRKHGGKVLLVARFLDVLRQLNGIVAGIVHMSFIRFQIFSALGAFLWVGSWGTLVYLVGHNVKGFHSILFKFEVAFVVALIAVATFFLFRMFHKQSRKN